MQATFELHNCFGKRGKKKRTVKNSQNFIISPKLPQSAIVNLVYLSKY